MADERQERRDMSGRNVTIGLAVLFGVALTVLGLRFLLDPEAGASGFGVPASAAGDASAYLATKGIRDTASGLFILALIAARQLHALGWLLLVATIIPVGDALVVLSHNGSAGLALGMHGGAALALVAVGLLLLRSQVLPAQTPQPAPVA
jgi:Domain of unknown function (DUF4267)